ncbi:MAG: Ig-like domain-containing protein [Balneolaceae bacterium]|nr:Ig-like domain-containing protein [Balneolaceae bacterium]
MKALYTYSNYFAGLIILAALVFIVKSCATPVAPSGGEPDRTGPVVVSTTPENGTTNFSGREVRFTFDKFVDRNSFRQNVSIEPDLGIEFDISFSRRSGVIEFTNPLPENTTIVIQAGTDVTDTNRNRMDRPHVLALSTGDVLDDGVITARVLDAETGRGESGRRVLLYREPFDLAERANYLAISDTSGTVQFGYISEGTYKAFWLNDVNRNRRWDRERERAQPFYVETVTIARGDSVHIGTLFVSTPDTLAPRIEGVGLLSERRLRLRLSEEVEFSHSSNFSVQDTLGNEFTTAWPLYKSDADAEILFAQTETALPESDTFTLQPEGFTDAAGNKLKVDFSPFTGSSEPDTTFLRTFAHNSGSGLFPNEPLEVTYTKFIDDAAVVDSLQIVTGERIIDDWPHVEIERNILRIFPDEAWESGTRYQFRVWNPYEEEREQIEPEIWQRNQLGSIEVTLQNHNPEYLSHLIITDEANSIRIDTTFTTSIEIDNLPPLTYKAKVFEDVNGNGRWNTGSIEPFERPEPYAIRRSIPVREGFTSEVELVYPLNGVEELIPIEIEMSEEEDEIDDIDSDDEQNEDENSGEH